MTTGGVVLVQVDVMNKPLRTTMLEEYVQVPCTLELKQGKNHKRQFSSHLKIGWKLKEVCQDYLLEIVKCY